MSVKAILAGQGSGGKPQFIATYGTTTLAEVVEAIEDGKSVYASGNTYGLIPLSNYYSDINFTSIDFSIASASTDGSSPVIYGYRLSENGWALISDTELAPTNSPNLTGTPTAPTAAAGTNTTQLATTAFVQTAANSKLSLISSSFDWGSETGDADEAWFEALSKAVPSDDWVGKTKSVTLTSAVLGTTTHLIRCIGVNQDGENTVTFQTANTLANSTAWSGSSWSSSDYNSALWTDTNCLTRQYCDAYYNVFPGKSYIKTISKGYCTTTDQSRGQTSVTYLDMQVFLPSEREMGLDTYAPITVANSSINNAECTKGYNEPYAYYTSNARRIKYDGDSSSTARDYWTRSRYSGSIGNYRGALTTVYSNGTSNLALYSDDYRMAPAFVIQCAPGYVFYQDNENVTEEVANALGLDNKQDVLTFDDVPTSGSTNPVTSDGIYQAVESRASVEDIGSLWVWEKDDYTPASYELKNASNTIWRTGNANYYGSNYYINYQVSDSINVDLDGTVTLVNPYRVTVYKTSLTTTYTDGTYSYFSSSMIGKYFTFEASSNLSYITSDFTDDNIYYWPSSAALKDYYVQIYAETTLKKVVGIAATFNFNSYTTSNQSTTYPDAGSLNSYYYKKIGKLGNMNFNQYLKVYYPINQLLGSIINGSLSKYMLYLSSSTFYTTWQYSDSIAVNDGNIELSGEIQTQQLKWTSDATTTAALINNFQGKYIKFFTANYSPSQTILNDTNSIIYIPSDATGTYGSLNNYYSFYPNKYYILNINNVDTKDISYFITPIKELQFTNNDSIQKQPAQLLGEILNSGTSTIETGSYTGTGTVYPSLNFSFDPKLVAIVHSDTNGNSSTMIAINGSESADTYGTYVGHNKILKFTDQTFSWTYLSGGNTSTRVYIALNASNVTYYYFAIG